MVGQIKHIVVIQSLSGDDRETGRELYDDIIRRNIDYKQPEVIKMTHKFIDVATKAAFVESVQQLIQVADSFSDGILIHLETHGAADMTGLILADGNLITWEELTDMFREINIATNNNLYITMATCLGRYMYQSVKTDRKAPYSGYISASKIVNQNEILEDFSVLFETLVETGNLVYSYLQMEKKGSNFFYKDCEATFEENFKKFIDSSENKEKIIHETKLQYINLTGEIMTDEDANLLYVEALRDNYIIQSRNFLFK